MTKLPLAPTTQQSIYSVSAIADLTLLRTSPPTLYMRVVGYVTTTGWTALALVPRTYVTPPADNIQEFDFLAVPPTGIALQVLTPVSAEVMMPLPDWARGVRVIAAANDVEQLFPVRLQPMTETTFSDVEKAEIGFLSSDETSIDTEALLIEEFEESGISSALRNDQQCSEFLLASTSIPETKTEWEIRCIATNPFNGKCIAKTKVPIVYRRTSKIRLIARICYPSGKAIEGHLKDCVQQAIIAGLVVSVLTQGNLAAAAATLKAYLIACIEMKLGEVIDGISVDIRREKIPGHWKKI